MTNKVELGSSGIYVNPIGLGTNAVGGHNLYPNLDEQQGMDLVKKAIESGINFLDTALLYGPYRSEELISEVLQEMNCRDEVVIATKIGAEFSEGKRTFNNSPDFLRREVDAALQRLQTDYIDLMYLHYPDEHTPKDEAIGALADLKKEGKIRAIGVSNFSLEQLEEANKEGHIDVFQGEYNLLNRSAEKIYLPYTRENQISFIPYFPLAAGVLAGKYNEQTKFNDLRANMPHFKGQEFIDTLAKVEQLRKIANTKGEEVVHVVLAWYLAQDGIDVVIPGAKKASQVESNLKTLNVELTSEEIKLIDDIFK